MVNHVLKTWTEFLDAIQRGEKTFEVRKDDRAFRVGDTLELKEWDPATGKWGSRWSWCRVTYILSGGQFGIEPGYVVMALSPPTNHREVR